MTLAEQLHRVANEIKTIAADAYRQQQPAPVTGQELYEVWLHAPLNTEWVDMATYINKKLGVVDPEAARAQHHEDGSRSGQPVRESVFFGGAPNRAAEWDRFLERVSNGYDARQLAQTILTERGRQ